LMATTIFMKQYCNPKAASSLAHNANAADEAASIDRAVSEQRT
jgi:hypothetical protein